ncbi:hypothetical protein PMSD_25200 [Paenibacillus macquariensis subsp. defensor]|nr:hypothetical protein PMSD_25200 [Paenibacillus macquariensis subsp. defensor]
MDIYEYIIAQTAEKKIDPSVATRLLNHQMQSQKKSSQDVAVIGMALQFPNSNDVQEFWDNICSRTNNITVFPESRKKDANAYFRMTGTEILNEYAPGAYIDRIDEFDYDYFGISPIEAKLMDLNQRLFLQIAVQAIEDAGYGIQSMSDSHTGVYLGFSDDFCQEYKTLVAAAQPDMFNLSVSGNVHSIIASRIAYILNLKGPAMLVDTACSSALTAIHLAIQGLNNGDCETAIVGGSKLSLVPTSSMLPIASSDGRCRAFDNDSDGTGFGEGVGAVLLKPLDKAIQDKDPIYAVIKGSAVNQDGASLGITAPNSQAQAEVLKKAWKNAGIEPETISYIETHGTGTKLGDPVEIDGITKAFGKYTNKKQFCAISSAKSGVGHLDHLAGIASFCKAVMALHHKQIPPTLHFRKPNRNISFENSPVYVNDKVTPWKEEATPRRCGVSSFGISGTNCHVVLEEYIESVQDRQKDHEMQMFLLSNKTPDGLMATLKKNLDFLHRNDGISLSNLCFTAQCYRDHHPCRMAFIVSSREELLEKIVKVIKSNQLVHSPDDGIFYGNLKIVSTKKVKQKDEIFEHEQQQHTSRAEKLLLKDITSVSMTELCSLYVNLADIKWSRLYQTEHTKVHYPGYSFMPERCWVSERVSNNELQYGKVTCVSKTKGQWIYSATFSPVHSWELTDHRLYGQPLLPGTAYVEFIKRVVDQMGDSRAVELSELVFLSPLLCKTDEPRELLLICSQEDSYIRFRIESEEKREDGNTTWLVHAEGTMKDLSGQMPAVDIDQLRRTYFNGDEIEVQFNSNEDGPISFGLRWDNVQKLSVIGNEGLAYLKLKEAFGKDHLDHIIHPALLDNAVNIAIQSIGNGLYLPWTYKSIRIYDRMPNQFYSYLTLKTNEINGEIVKFDVQLFDETGKVFIEVKDYAIKRASPLEIGGTLEPMPEVFSISWVNEEREDKVAPSIKEDIVLFHLQDHIPDKLIQEFNHNGHKLTSVGLFKMEQKDFAAIFNELTSDHPVKFIFYAGESHAEFESTRQLQVILDQTLYAFYHFIHSFLRGNWKMTHMEIVLIVREVNEITGEEQMLQPHYASLLGLGKVIPQEYSNIKCKALDIDGNFDVKKLYEEIVGSEASYCIGMRDNHRYRMELRENKASVQQERGIKLKKGGVYIITGGTGGLGLEIAKHIASQQEAHIVLVQRTAMPERSEWRNPNQRKKVTRAIATIQEIEATGSTVTLHAADITSEEQVKEMLDSIRRRFGAVTGIVHCAGQAGVGFLLNKQAADFQKVIDPKVRGTWLLDHETRYDNLDFFILFSSITSLLGGMGQSDYTAANAFMDAFAYFRNRRNSNTIVLNWGPWRDTGMVVDYKVKDVQPFKQLSTSGALQVFDYALSNDIPQLVAGSLNTRISPIPEYYLPLSQPLANRNSAQITKHKEQPALNLDEKNFRERISPDNVLAVVSSIWEKVLEIKEIDIYKSFALLGGDSIIAAYLVKEMEKKFGSIVDITDIFTYPSVYEIASHIEETLIADAKPFKDTETQTLPGVSVTEPEDEIDEAYLDDLVSRLVDEKNTLDKIEDLLSKGSMDSWKK